jgi:hypothetical protein
VRRQRFFQCVLAAVIGATLALHSRCAEPATKPTASAGSGRSQAAAASSLNSYRQHLERLLPKGWSIQARQNELIVTRREKVLVAWHHPNAHTPPDPPAVSIDGRVYLPGKGNQKKTVYIDEAVATPNGETPCAMRTVPYHLFELAPGRPVPDTRNDVSYRHEPYAITIRFLPLLSADDYRRLIDVDKARKAKIDNILKELQSRKLTQKFDEFLPKTDDDRKLIGEYEQLKKSVQPLPRFHTDRYTIEVEDSLAAQSPYSPQYFASRSAGKQAKSIRQQIEKMFSRY